MNRSLLVFAFSAFLLVLAGCDNGNSTLITDGSLEELEQEIKAMIEPPLASSAAQCRTIAFGAKACGGPHTYLVYSTARTNEGRLRNLVNAYNRRDAERNESLGLVSDCKLVSPPPVTLVGGQCVAVSP